MLSRRPFRRRRAPVRGVAVAFALTAGAFGPTSGQLPAALGAPVDQEAALQPQAPPPGQEPSEAARQAVRSELQQTMQLEMQDENEFRPPATQIVEP